MENCSIYKGKACHWHPSPDPAQSGSSLHRVRPFYNKVRGNSRNIISSQIPISVFYLTNQLIPYCSNTNSSRVVIRKKHVLQLGRKSEDWTEENVNQKVAMARQIKLNQPALEILEAWLWVTVQALACHLIQWLQLVLLEMEKVYRLQPEDYQNKLIIVFKSMMIKLCKLGAWECLPLL